MLFTVAGAAPSSFTNAHLNNLRSHYDGVKLLALKSLHSTRSYATFARDEDTACVPYYFNWIECRAPAWMLLEQVKQHRVTGYGCESHRAADHSTHDPLSSGGFQSCDFIHDLLSPALANLVSTLADGIGFCGVIVDPVEDPNVSQFVVELC